MPENLKPNKGTKLHRMIPRFRKSWKTIQPLASIGLLTIATILLAGVVSCYRSMRGVPDRISNLPGATSSSKTGEPTEETGPPDPLRPQIRFSHKLHGEQAECVGCHATVEEQADAGVPKLSDCLDCHDGMQSEKPEDQVEEKKLDVYAAAKREIQWRRSAYMAPGVKFSHKVHIVEAELDCKDCHGDIAQTNTLPRTPAIPYTHELCGECHDVEKKEGEKVAEEEIAEGEDAVGKAVAEGGDAAEEGGVDCRMCHQR